MDIGILEACGILAAISAGLGGPVAVVRWCSSQMDKRVTDSEARTKIVHDAQAQKINDTASRVDKIEREHQSHIERTVRLESHYANLDKGQEAIKQQLADLKEDSKAGRAEIIESIRELRTVSPKT